MPARIVITDDGDETCFIDVDGVRLQATIDHEAYGWAGMPGVFELIEELAQKLGVRVDNRQSIV
jgi:hypothetical protein